MSSMSTTLDSRSLQLTAVGVEKEEERERGGRRRGEEGGEEITDLQ